MNRDIVNAKKICDEMASYYINFKPPSSKKMYDYIFKIATTPKMADLINVIMKQEYPNIPYKIIILEMYYDPEQIHRN